jgi:hypothetical protein
VAAGSEITVTTKTADGVRVVLRTGHVYLGTDREDRAEDSVEPVAEFRPDGTLDRDEHGAPRVSERVVRRTVSRPVVTVRAPSGEVWSLLLEK